MVALLLLFRKFLACQVSRYIHRLTQATRSYIQMVYWILIYHMLLVCQFTPPLLSIYRCSYINTLPRIATLDHSDRYQVGKSSCLLTPKVQAERLD
jgi:hypothetical protein